MAGKVESINTSRGGVPKTAVLEALVSEGGIEGDHQNDRRYHGGPDRAVSLFSFEAIEALQREGHPIAPGTAGENLTISGLDWSALTPGRELQIGSVRLAITNHASPCEKITGSFHDGRVARIAQRHHPGWSRLYARVLAGGVVRPGDVVHLVER